MTGISATGLGKCYKLYSSPRARFLELVTGRPRHQTFWALRDVDLHVGRGESVGIIGNNGAGKSTLLKLLTGVLPPTTGQVERTGRLTSILELGTGFHPGFTGRENAFFAGSVLGIPRAEVAARLPEIVEFAELDGVIDRPIKTYSSGMTVRLAFSLMTSVNPEILVVDEALAVGDQRFQKKCIDRMSAFRDRGCTILFCSHSMHHISHFCERTIWLENGAVVADGETATVIDAYVGSVNANQAEDKGEKKAAPAKNADENRYCMVNALRLVDAGPDFRRGETVELEIEFTILRSRTFVHAITVDRKDGIRMIAESSLGSGLKPVWYEPGRYLKRMRFDTALLAAGRYEVSVGLLDESLLHIDDFHVMEITVSDIGEHRMPALARTEVDWGLEETEQLTGEVH